MKGHSQLIITMCLLMSSGCFIPTINGKRLSSPSSSSGLKYNFKTWIAQFTPAYFSQISSAAGTDEFWAVAMDSYGHTYAAGRSDGSFAGANSGSYDGIIAKLNAAGTLLWVKQLTPAYSGLISSAAGTEDIWAITVDSDGNSYFCGTTTGSFASASGGGNDVFVGKIDSSGNLSWLKQFTPAYSALISSAAGAEKATAISIDSAGNSFITGFTASSLAAANGGINDIFVAKIDSAGTLVWIKQFVAAYSGLIVDATTDDEAFGIAVDSTGNSYVTGYTDGGLAAANGGGVDTVLAKLDSSGNLSWIKQFTPAYSGLINSALANDIANGVKVDSSGNIFIVGQTLSSFASANAGLADIFVAKIDTSGNLTWIKQFTPAYSGLINDASNEETSSGISIDDSGNIYVAGYTLSSLAIANAGLSDTFLSKIDSSGSLVWIKQLTPAYSGLILDATGQDEVYAVASDPAGNSCMVGITTGSLFGANAGFSDPFMIHIDSAGSL